MCVIRFKRCHSPAFFGEFLHINLRIDHTIGKTLRFRENMTIFRNDIMSGENEILRGFSLARRSIDIGSQQTGSLAGHKNFKWIREVARRNPDKTFVVAGGKDLRAFGDDTEAKDTHNVFYPGYVSDAENAALMKHCRLFLHPAVFEGFGIPPLEALALGAPIALAKASCLPELYGDTARYFDPYDYEVDLDALAARPVAPPDKVLAKYSWDKTAAFWLEEIKKYAQQ